MWIPRPVYDALHSRLTKAEAVAAVLERQNAILVTLADSLRLAFNRSEKERGQLLFNYMGVKVEVPQIETAPTGGNTGGMPFSPEQLQGFFSDVGDTEAKRLGISYNSDGTVRYSDEKTE